MKGGIILIRILIVDDEPKVRRGLVSKLDWERLGCMVIGEADNGNEAKQMIEAHHPDIVITDIKMPGMNGLELSEYINDHYPDIKVILLTGYDEFSFAQAAIHSNVFSYLVKPTLPKEITEVVGSAVRQIELARKEKEDIKHLREMLDTAIPVMRNQILHEMLSGFCTNMDSLLERAELCGIQIRSYCVVVMELFRYLNSEENRYEKELLDRLEVREAMREVMKGPELEIFESLNGEKPVFLVYSGNPSGLREADLIEKVRRLRDTLKKTAELDTFIAVSPVHCDVRDIHRVYCRCLNALSFRDIFTSDSIILTKDIQSIEDDTYSFAKLYANRLNENINACNRDKVRMILRDMFDIFSRSFSINLNHVKEMIWTVLYNLEKDMFFSGGGLEIKLLTACNKQKIIGASALEEVFTNTSAIFEAVIEQIIQGKRKKYNEMIRRACDYIENNYNRGISLDDVSAYTGISSSYLSRMFKDQMKMNFVEYLAKVRINKAKKFLEQPHVKAREVGEWVGIYNPAYFGSLFKKYTGKTPTEYREFVLGNQTVEKIQ